MSIYLKISVSLDYLLICGMECKHVGVFLLWAVWFTKRTTCVFAVAGSLGALWEAVSGAVCWTTVPIIWAGYRSTTILGSKLQSPWDDYMLQVHSVILVEVINLPLDVYIFYVHWVCSLIHFALFSSISVFLTFLSTTLTYYSCHNVESYLIGSKTKLPAQL